MTETFRLHCLRAISNKFLWLSRINVLGIKSVIEQARMCRATFLQAAPDDHAFWHSIVPIGYQPVIIIDTTPSVRLMCEWALLYRWIEQLSDDPSDVCAPACAG